MTDNQTFNKRKRIVFVITGLSTGGAQMMLYKLLTLIDRNLFDPVVVSLMDKGKFGDRIEALNIPVYAINISSEKPSFASIRSLISTVRKIKPDLLQGWLSHGNIAAQLASIFLFKPIPVVWNVRHLALSKLDAKERTLKISQLLAYLSYLPSRIIYNSKLGADQHEQSGYCHSKTTIIPNGFDTKVLTPSLAARNKVRAELNLAEDTFIISLFGRYDPVKDHFNFLKAAVLLLEVYPETHFLLAGENVDDQNKLLCQSINSLNLSKRVHLLGVRQDIPYLTAALDIATSASFTEGFANVIGEAMACGVPCVVTDVGDSAWIVGTTGIVVKPRDSQALCNAWLELINLGREARYKLGIKARERIEEKYSLAAIVKQYEQLYLDAVGSKK
jgi:glycosyltransferase involved in cell wall biosynthesis